MKEETAGADRWHDLQTSEDLKRITLGILRDGEDPAMSRANAQAMIEAATTYLRETEALPDPHRPAEDLAAEMVCTLDRMPEDQGHEITRAMIAAAGIYLQKHFGETVVLDTVSSIMGYFVCAEMLQRHEASPAGPH